MNEYMKIYLEWLDFRGPNDDNIDNVKYQRYVDKLESIWEKMSEDEQAQMMQWGNSERQKRWPLENI
jgi:hypothetical protein